MKIDFHCHTKKTKQSELDTRNVSEEVFKQKVIDSGVKIVVITNHNHFDKQQYKLLSDSVKDYCMVWPGIELDVSSKSESQGHVILICNPDQTDIFFETINKLIGNKTADDVLISLVDVYDKFKELDIIYVAHFLKHKSLSLDGIEELENLLEDKRKLFKEPSSLTSVSVLQAHKQRVIIGTDVKDWNHYEKCTFGELKFSISCFDNFKKLIGKDIDFINGMINDDFSENVKVYGKLETMEFPFQIPIYNNVNIIFGDKGSGKSEILKSLDKYYKEDKNIDTVYFKGGEKKEWYENIIKNNEADYNLGNLNLSDDLSLVLNNIISFVDTTPIQLKNYTDYFQKKSNNAKKEKMKIINIQKRHLNNDDKYISLYNEYKEIKMFADSLINYKSYKLLEESEKKFIFNVIKNLELKSFELAKDEWINQKTEYLFDNFVENINEFVSQNTGMPVQPTSTGFASFSKNRIKLKNNANIFLNKLENISEIKSEYIGNLGIKGDVSLKKEYFFVNKNNKELVDSKLLKTYGTKTDLKNMIISLGNIITKYCDSNLNLIVTSLKEGYDKGIKSLEDFLVSKKYFSINEENYIPSSGEMAILSLQHNLLTKQEKKVFLIDEPELSLGSNYVNDTIVPLFNNLSNAKKIVVIATHDPNIAVRTRPVNSILKITVNTMYNTYIGNMFTNQLVNINNDLDILDWKVESIKYLEGGENAFLERGELYE